MNMQMDVFEALADPTRRHIVDALYDGEHTVKDIVARVAIHQSGVSRHLGILQKAGFVDVRPVGAQRLYSLKPEPFWELATWIDRYRHFWEARLDKLGEELERRRKARAAATAASR